MVDQNMPPVLGNGKRGDISAAKHDAAELLELALFRLMTAFGEWVRIAKPSHEMVVAEAAELVKQMRLILMTVAGRVQ